MTPIIKAGLYDIDISAYHSQACCDGPSISSSGLRKILHECPARFWAYSDLNPKPFAQPEKKSLSFGRAAHALMLGEPEFAKHFCVAPHDKFNANPGKAWHDVWKSAVEAGREHRDLVRPSELTVIKDMVAAQRASEEVANAFTQGAPERSIIWKDEETGVWLKARPDWLPNDPATRFVTEYKTAETINPRRLSNAVFQYGYEIQAALGLDGIEAVMDVKPLGMAHVVQEKDAPYLAELRLFSSEQIDFGRLQYRKALRIFARCLETGIWPGWTAGPSYFDTPFYISKAMENFSDDIGNGTADSYSGADYLAAG